MCIILVGLHALTHSHEYHRISYTVANHMRLNAETGDAYVRPHTETQDKVILFPTKEKPNNHGATPGPRLITRPTAVLPLAKAHGGAHVCSAGEMIINYDDDPVWKPYYDALFRMNDTHLRLWSCENGYKGERCVSRVAARLPRSAWALIPQATAAMSHALTRKML